MVIYSGKLGYIGLGYQVNSASPVTPTMWISVTDANFDTQPTHDYPKEYRKQMESTVKPIRTGQESTGSMKMAAYPGGGLETMLNAAFGTVVTTPIITATAWQHTYSINQSDIPAYSVVLGLGPTTPDRFPYAKLKTLKINLAEGKPVEMDTTWLSKGVDRSLDLFTPSYGTNTAFTFLDAGVTLDGTPSTMVETMDITIDRATDSVKTMNASRDPTYIIPTDFKTTGTMTLLFDGDSEYKRFLGTSTATSMQSSATPVTLGLNLSGGMISGTTPFKMVMSWPEAYYNKITFDPLTDSTVKIGFDWTAAKPLTATPSCSCYVWSTTSPVI